MMVSNFSRPRRVQLTLAVIIKPYVLTNLLKKIRAMAVKREQEKEREVD